MFWFLFKKNRRKIRQKIAFLTRNKAKLCKILFITLDFEKNAKFFDKNCRKSQKIMIITSTPGLPKLWIQNLTLSNFEKKNSSKRYEDNYANLLSGLWSPLHKWNFFRIGSHVLFGKNKTWFFADGVVTTP
jgi:hypothetical protein